MFLERVDPSFSTDTPLFLLLGLLLTSDRVLVRVGALPWLCRVPHSSFPHLPVPGVVIFNNPSLPIGFRPSLIHNLIRSIFPNAKQGCERDNQDNRDHNGGDDQHDKFLRHPVRVPPQFHNFPKHPTSLQTVVYDHQRSNGNNPRHSPLAPLSAVDKKVQLHSQINAEKVK